MVHITTFWRRGIRYTRLLFHLFGSVGEGEDSCIPRFHIVVDLVQSMCVIGLPLQVLDQYKGSMRDDFCSRVMVRRGTCTKTSRLPSTTSSWLR
jgi:hypothetical protein